MPKFDGLNHEAEPDNLKSSIDKLNDIMECFKSPVEKIRDFEKKNGSLAELSKLSDAVASSAGMDPIKSAVKAGGGIKEFPVSKTGFLPEMLKQCEEVTKNKLLAESSKMTDQNSTDTTFLRSIPPLHDSATKEKTMELQQNSKEYKEFLRLVEELAEARDWVRGEVQLFCNGYEVRQARLSAAIDNGRINYKPKKKKGILSDLGDESQELDDLKREYITACLSGSLGESEYILLEAESFLSWLKQEYPHEGEELIKSAETTEEKVSELSLDEILRLITPEMYPDGLKRQERSAITNSLNTLKEQIPKAFELCCSLVIEAMTCEGRDEFQKYRRDDIEKLAEKKGISTPTARQIHKALPPAMLKK